MRVSGLGDVIGRAGPSSDVLLEPSFAHFLLVPIHGEVHAELLSLQPDAEFPSLERRPLDGGAIEVEYRSPRNLAPMAQGMLLGCLDYFGADGSVSREDLPTPAGHACRLIVQASPA